ncbi:MAG TPA: hypothetical protein VKB42_05295 [Dongiaceae bacterium]|nr:hypothetical protein [Dongiaceae bacterium]
MPESAAADEVVVPLRPAATVMRLARLGSFHPTRLSFTRSLIRRMGRESWRFHRRHSALDASGYGRIVYEIETPRGRLSFCGFSNPLAPEERTDRVIAEKWDAAFALSAGRIGDSAIERLSQSTPRQEVARYGADDLVLSRANRSVRLFDKVAASLAAGRQPDLGELVQVGYLMRTTAVYGNGKFGLADLPRLWREGVFSLPYEAEMLTVYMIRQFSFDLIEHIARTQNPAGAVALAPLARRALGIGNATGLGMAPFLVSHPMLFNNWILARETALARVRAAAAATPVSMARFRQLLDRAIAHLGQWNTDDERQQARILRLRAELAGLRASAMQGQLFGGVRPWDRLVRAAETEGTLEYSELVNSLVIELHPELVDELEASTGSPEQDAVDPRMSLAALKALIETRYGWVLSVDYEDPRQHHLFWYRSAEKDEPRLGERFNEPGAERELPLGIGLMAAALHRALAALPAAALSRSTGEFLLEQPRWRGILRRIQSLAPLPYGEIQDNLLGEACLPIDLLRCKLSIFGAAKFDPKSDRWTRITLFQGAPSIEELGDPDADDWAFPAFPTSPLPRFEAGEGGTRSEAAGG